MTAFAAGAIATAAIGGVKLVEGENQKAEAKRLAAANRFVPQKIPGQVKLATNLAAENYYNGMPGQTKAVESIKQNGANTFYNGSQGASSGGDLIDLANKIGVGENVATNDLATKAASYKASALGGYQGALGTEGAYEDKLYTNNILQPYLNTANAASSMYGAGAENEFGGLDQIATAGLGYANGLQTKKLTKAVTSGTNPLGIGDTASLAAMMSRAHLNKGRY